MNIDERLEKGAEIVALRLFREDGYSSDQSGIAIQVCYVDDNNQPSFYQNYPREKRQLKDVYIRCYMARDFNGCKPYGFNLTVGSKRRVELFDAEQIIKTLKPIHRKLEKIEQLEGYPQSFEEYVIRLVRVLEVGAYWPAPTKNRIFSIQPDMRFFRRALSDLIEEIKSSIEKSEAA